MYCSGFENRDSSAPLSDFQKKSENPPDGGGQARTHRTSQVRPVQPAPPVCTTPARTNCARRASVSCVVHARQVARPVSCDSEDEPALPLGCRRPRPRNPGCRRATRPHWQRPSCNQMMRHWKLRLSAPLAHPPSSQQVRVAVAHLRFLMGFGRLLPKSLLKSGW